MKLATAAAVLRRLDAGQRLRTRAVAAAPPVRGIVEGDLWLVGGGDPVLGTLAWAAHFTRQPALITSLEELADRIVAEGVREVWGNPWVPFTDPAAGGAGVLAELLRERGVAVQSEAAAGSVPAGHLEIAASSRPPWPTSSPRC